MKSADVSRRPRRAWLDDSAIASRLAAAGPPSVVVAELTLLLITFLVFFLSPVLQVGDSRYSMLLSENIIRYHSTHLNRYTFPGPVEELDRSVPPTNADARNTRTYQLGRVKGNVVYLFPNGSSILSLPFIAAASWLGWNFFPPGGAYDEHAEVGIEKILAAILMAVLTFVIFRTGLHMLGTAESVVIAVGAAFGTQIWSTTSRAMWSHTWLILLEAVVILDLLRCEEDETGLHPILLATLLSWMYFVRPTAAVVIACLTVYVILFHRRDFLLYAATGGLWFVGFVGYAQITFGEFLPGYFSASRLEFRNFATALQGVLISPSRGLFIFVPIAVFVIYRVARYWRALPHRRLAALALITFVLQILTAAGFPKWWGGWSYGPRLLSDAVPWLVLLAILGQKAAASEAISLRGRLELAAAAVLLALSIWINGRGALSWATGTWNAAVDIDHHPERAFDWSRPQFLAGLIDDHRAAR